MIHRAIWLSDIHLNFIDSTALTRFAEILEQEKADSVLISGDIGEGTNMSDYLRFFDRNLSVPVYFVLGNHDYYHGSIHGVRQNVSILTAETSRLTYLSGAGVIQLSEATVLIGHDGWADGRIGDYANSEVILNDYVLIEEFVPKSFSEHKLPLLSKADRLSIMQSLASEAATHFAKLLPAALDQCEHIVVVTHVPPFREACWHDRKISSPEFLPHFSCQAVGDILLKAMEEHPNKRMTVLCGHTHGQGEVMVRPNLRVLTAGAEYTQPRIQQVLTLPNGDGFPNLGS